jgi:predicted phosphoribosyltransferase
MGKLKIVSRSSEPFTSREEAGKLLARELTSLKGKNVVVLGIPRGGIIAAREIASALKGDLDVVLSHKLRTPGHQELAMGAIAESGIHFVDQRLVRMMGIDQQMIEREKAFQMTELKHRSEEVRKIRPKEPLEGRTVIITDDGVATGATTTTAVRAVRAEKPSRLILALPVGSEDSVVRLSEEADETICLRTPANFMAVGQFYMSFGQVSDEEMLEILRAAYKKGKEAK